MPTKYDSFVRPNYEGIGATGWLLGGALAVGATTMVPLPPEPFWAMSAIAVLMAGRRAPAALRLLQAKMNLKGVPLTFVKRGKLAKILARHKDQLWLGYGFEWDQKHTQLAFDIMGHPKEKVLGKKRRDPMATGAAWIHGIEQDEEELSQPLKHTEGHVLITGTTGSGKTRLFDHLITQAILRGEAVYILDPKGDRDLCENARRACELAGRPESFVYFHPAFPEKSWRIDPLRNFNRATELASRIGVLVPSESGADPFKAFSQMALNNINQGLLLSGERPSLISIRRYLEGGTEKLVTSAIAAYCDAKIPHWESMAGGYLAKANNSEKRAYAMVRFYEDAVQPHFPSPDLEGLISMFRHDREHFSKMVASLLPIMNMLTSGDLGPLLSPDPNDPDDERPITDNARIIRNKQVAYIGLDSLSDAMVGSAIGSILLSDLTAVAGDRYNYGLNNDPVNIFVDEVVEVLNDPMIQSLNKGRGAGYSLYVATQTLADFMAKLGSDAKARQVLGNINNLITLRVTDSETQKYICDSLAETRVRYIMSTQATTSSNQSPGAQSGNIGERLMEERVPLIPSQLLGLLPNLEYFARLVDGRLVKGRLPILLKEDQ